MFPVRRKALSIALLIGTLATPIIAGPAAANDVQRYQFDFPPVGFTWSFACGADEVDGTITVNNETGTDFFDGAGNWYRTIVSGQLRADLFAPSTGQTYRLNISGPGIFAIDPTSQDLSKYALLGHEIFFGGHYVYYGHLDLVAGTRVGVRIDLCPKVGLSS